MSVSTKRLSILNENEIHELFGRPVFSNDDRATYFSLEQSEQFTFESLRYSSTRLLFVLQLGYFKASRRFFTFSWDDVQEDVNYLLRHVFPLENHPNTFPKKNTRLAQQKIILTGCRYRRFGQHEHQWLFNKVKQLAKLYAQPRLLLAELLQLLNTERITIPGYTTFQKIIGRASHNEQQRLNDFLQEKLSYTAQSELNKLLVQEGAFYQLSALKKRAKDFRLKETRQEIQKHSSIHLLYECACTILPQLETSNRNIQYYASLAEYYPVHRLQQMDDNQAQLFLLCFVKHCFERISDNLIISFIYQVSTLTQKSIKISKQQLSDYHNEHQQQLVNAQKLIQLFVDPSIDDQLSFKKVKQQAFKIMDEPHIQDVLNYLSGDKANRLNYEWEYIRKSSRKTAFNIRPLLMALDFRSTLDDDPLIQLVRKLKTMYQAGNMSPSTQFIEQIESLLPKKLKHCLNHIAHYEFFIYQKLKEGLDAGDVFYNSSTRFKSFSKDLISKQELHDKQPLLASLGYSALTKPLSQRLATLKIKLEQRYKEVNENIANGKNTHLKLYKKGSDIQWNLPYKKQEDSVNNPFYEQLPQVGIINILHYVNRQCHFLESFAHIQQRYTKNQPDNTHILACLIAYGERIGIHSMADISDMKYHLLRTSSKSYIRLDTLRKANDIIANAISELPLFQHYNLNIDSLHASADGQKFETQRSTFKARYSRKYFGLNKGVVNYTMVANHVPVNARLIGANEHESHYAFDIIYNNTSDIEPDVISTDMAGTNQVNFALLETFDRSWAPRYTHINRKATRLVGFQPIHDYPHDYVIKPSRQVNESLMLTENNNLQQIFASMALKTMTQATLVRKLSSYARKNRTKKALWELDNIYMSLYVLDYIDDITA